MLWKSGKRIPVGSFITVIDPLIVSELFYSIQGESTWAGLPCAFIRLSGCNLRCRYCDASYTWDEPGTEMSSKDVLHWLDQYPGVLTEITGGEPLLQGSIHPLTVQLKASVIMDVKCPGSGMDDKVYWQNLDMLAIRKKMGSSDEIKFVISSEQDFHWAMEKVKEHRLEQLVPVLFSPVIGLIKPNRLAELILTSRLPVRLQLQLHTLLWPGQSRGV